VKKQFVKDLKPGTIVNDVFLCSRRDVKDRRDGGQFMAFEFRDRTGSVNGIMWDRVDDALRCVEAGGFYRVQGRLGDYQGKPQLTVSLIYPAEPVEVSRDDFMAVSQYDRAELMTELRGYVAGIANPHLRALLDLIFGDAALAERFALAPGGAAVHHACLGGLLEHTMLMCRLARNIAGVYREVDADLLLAGTILHDIGKVEEYDYDVAIAHTLDGRLVGHIVIGYRLVEQRIAEIPGFPAELARMLLHIILSHHGQMEFGSPKTPKFVEAFIVYFLDNLDARVAMFRDTVERNPGVKWTDFNQYLETNVYVRDPAGPGR
jgi:3'-5' exoribonuclease